MPPNPVVVIMAAEPTVGTWQAALTRHGLTVVVVNRRGLADALSRQPAAVLLDASLFNGLQEMQAALRNGAAAIYAVMPGAAGEGERVAVSRLPNVKGVYGPDTSVADIARTIVAQVKPVNDQIDLARPVAQAPNQTPVSASVEARPVRRQIRVGFYGTRGGVGVSTTALKVAQLIAARGMRVALFDATGRGDLHVMLGAEPNGPLIKDGMSVFSGSPQEEAVNGYEAVVIDGGRQERAFNAPWIGIERLPGDQAVARWAAVDEAAPRGLSFSLPHLPQMSFEVTA